MTIAIVLSIAFLVWAFFYSFHLPFSQKEERQIVKSMCFAGIGITWSAFVLTMDGQYFNIFVYVFFMIVVCYFVYFMRNLVKNSTRTLTIEETQEEDFIKAKKESYWDIPSQKIINFFNYRREMKKDRVETHLNRLSKKFYRVYGNDEKYLTTNILQDMNDIELTHLENLDDIKRYPLYYKIFKKIEDYNISAENSVDYDELLLSNDNKAEYFLIELWCKYTKRLNIGTANLIVLAENFTQSELIGALDNADLNSVKRHGAGLYFKYVLFKNLIPDEVLNEEKLAKQLMERQKIQEIKEAIEDSSYSEVNVENMIKSVEFYEDILKKEGL